MLTGHLAFHWKSSNTRSQQQNHHTWRQRPGIIFDATMHVDTYVAELDAAAAVAALVERRRPHAGAHHVGNHEHDGA